MRNFPENLRIKHVVNFSNRLYEIARKFKNKTFLDLCFIRKFSYLLSKIPVLFLLVPNFSAGTTFFIFLSKMDFITHEPDESSSKRVIKK